MAVDWSKFDYEKEIKVDLDSLELCNQENAELGMKYGKEKVRLSKLLKQKKEELAVYTAQLKKEIIAGWDGGKKWTVGEVDAEITLDEKHQQLEQEIIELEYEYDLLKEAVQQFSRRGYDLQELRELLALGYWARTSKTQGYKRQVQQASEASDASREAVNERRRRRQKQ
ncbi:MAG: hypothetical protein WDA09_05980 [Bacteriovoracaceae bacterium]